MTQFQQSASVLTFGFKKFDPYAAMMFLRRWLAVILSVAAIVFLVSGAALMLIKPLYKAAALIQIDLNSAGVIDREAATARGAIDSGFVDSQIEVLKSPALARRVVESLGLDKDPDFGRQKGGIFSFPSFLSRNWQAEPEASVTSPAVAKLIESLSIERRGSGYVISVGFTWPDPIKAAEYANALAHTYLEDQIATRSVQMQRAAAIFNERIALLTVDVRNAEMAVEQFKTENNLHDTHGVTLNDQQLSEITTLLIKAREDVAERAARYKQLQELLARGGSAATIADVLQSPAITNLKAQRSEVMRREAQMKARYGSSHPLAGFELAGILAEQRHLDALISEEVEKVVTNIKNELEVARSRQTSLEDSLRTVSESQNTGREASVQLRELERRAEASRVIYRSLLDQLNAAQEKRIVGEAKARIISGATAPVEPSFPKMAILMPFSAVLGLLLGVGSAYFLEKMDGAFYSGEDVETKLRLPVLSTLPQIGSRRKAQRDEFVPARWLKDGRVSAYAESLRTLLLSTLPQIGSRRKAQRNEFVPARWLKDGPVFSAYAESVRTLRGALDLSLGGEANRVIMVTSSVPCEGKTSIVVALATSIACAGKSVVVVELDLRRPRIGKQLGISGTPGILEFMDADSQDLKDYMTYRDDLKISLMVANRSLNDPAPVLACPKLAQALDVLASRFDYVILDTPPLTPVIDSRLIANISTGIIFVVKWGDTPHEVVSQNLRYLVGTKARVLGVALNAMDLKRQKLYSRYGGGYYHSRYAVYYGSRQRSSVSRKWQDDTASDDGVESGVTGPQLRCSVSKD